MDKHELSNSTGSASSFLSKIGKSLVSKGSPPPLPGATHTGTEKRVEIQFRCAKSGERFTVRFKDNGADRLHTIVNIVKSSAPPSGSSGESSIIIWTPDPYLRKPHSKPEDLKKPEGPIIPAARLDWSGWYCPHCLWGRGGSVGHNFLQCGKCSQFVCGSRVESKSNGKEFFHCHPECGIVVELGGGTIGNFETNEWRAPDPNVQGSDVKGLGGGPQGYLNG